MCENFRPVQCEIGEIRLQHCRDASVKFLATAAQERAVGSVLHERVLEQIGGVGRNAAAEQEAGVRQLAKRDVEVGSAVDAIDQLIAERAAEDGAHLRHFLCRCAEPVEPRDQRGLQGRRDRQRRRRARRQYRLDAVSRVGAFQHRPCQFLDEQRYAASAFDDFGDDVGVERGIAGEVLHEHRAIAAAEPVQCKCCHMRLAAPLRLEFWPESNDDQNRKIRDAVDRQIEQFTRRRIDPLRILENEQHRRAAGDCLELAE